MKKIKFVEEDYLELNPDVKVALGKGLIKSGKEHYSRFGKNEGRRINKNQKTREQKILSKINKQEKGLEIGPSHRPIASKKMVLM